LELSARSRPKVGEAKMTRHNLHAAGAFLALVIVATAAMTASAAQSADLTDAGKAVFKRANCFGCHKWHGNGGGGYGGDALSLRKTELTREQIIETVQCGRPGTGMPFFTRGAYDSVKCYGMIRQDVGDPMPPEANTFLRPSDIEAVADYVIAHVKSKGEPTHSECTDFFGTTSHVCDIYKAQQPAGTDTPTSGQSK
jgi:mono/diheme cytochrome c family protein